MAVYTEVTDEALAAFLADYDIGRMVAFRGIAEGVENSNFSLRTTSGDFILTLYEKRVDPAELPWFLGLMEHLAGRGIVCPLPVHGRDGAALRHCAGGTRRSPRSCRACGRAGCGRSIARRWAPRWPRCTWPGGIMLRRGAMRWDPTAGGRCWSAAGRGADQVQAGLATNWTRHSLAFWRHGRPGCRSGTSTPTCSRQRFFPRRAAVGADRLLFRRHRYLSYDVAVCLNAWCFEPDFSFNVTKARAMLRAYEATRPLSPAERAALPVLCQGAAIRFVLTRLYDWINTPPGAMVTRKDPLEYVRRLRFHLSARDERPMVSEEEEVTVTPGPPAAEVVEIWTDGGCKPNPGPGGWAAILRFRGVEKELSGADPATTNNRMELTAAATALETLKRPCEVVLHTDSEYVRNGVTRWHRAGCGGTGATPRVIPSPTWSCGGGCWRPRRAIGSSGAGCADIPAIR